MDEPIAIPFNADAPGSLSLLSHLRNRSMLILGDSLMLQLFSALRLDLQGRDILFTCNNGLHQSTRCFFHVTKSTITLLECYDVVFPPYYNETRETRKVVRYDALLALMNSTDVVLLYFGSHWHSRVRIDLERLCKKHNLLRTTLEQEPAQLKLEDPRRCYFIGTPFAQHIRGGDGTHSPELDTKPPCLDIALRRPHSEIALLSQGTDSVPVWDFWELTREAGFYHSKYDCSHWAFCPELYAPVFHLLASSLDMYCKM